MAKKKPIDAIINNPDAASSDATPTDIKNLPKREKRALGFIAATAVVTILTGLILGAYAVVNYRYEAAPKGEAREVVFQVPKGSGLSSIAGRLEKEGLIKSAFIFKLVTKLRGNEANFKAGEFTLKSPVSMRQTYEALAKGKAVLYPFTAPEGLTSTQIIRAMSANEALTGEVINIPEEGTLLPETYMVPRAMDRAELIAQMQRAQTELIDKLWETRQKELPITTKQEAIILASVVEKETGVGGERDVVAGVFINRLRKGMRLQSDPTIIYGVSKGEPLFNKKGQRRTLYRSEIDRKTDWNTYQIDGLPKTPICNPGAKAIAAVLDPAETDYLFFVADGSGGHVFAKTVAQHNKNVKNWRKIERKRQREQR